jgi:protein-disulfide isomerase
VKLKRRPDERDWVRGPLHAGGPTLVEYGDFQCPYCGRAYWELRRLEEALGDGLALVFRHFPITRSHPYAQVAAEAAEAAGAQGRFWQMHDLLYENQRSLEPDRLLEYARRLDLDVQRFARELESHRHLSKVRRDFMEGVRSGVNGTPTFFIGGERYDGEHTADGLLAALRGEAGPTAFH